MSLLTLCVKEAQGRIRSSTFVNFFFQISSSSIMCSKDPRCQSKPRLTKIFYKKADGKYFRMLQLYSLCCNSAVFHRRKITKNINKVQSCFLINLYLQNRLWARVRAGIFDSRSVCPESLGKFEMPFFGGVWLLSNEMQRNLTQS